MQNRHELALIVVDGVEQPPEQTDVESAIGEITEQWEWPEMDFIKDIRYQEIPVQDEVPPNPPIDMPAVVVALEQMPTSHVEPGEIYTGPPSTDDPLHDLVTGLYDRMDSIEIHIDSVEG